MNGKSWAVFLFIVLLNYTGCWSAPAQKNKPIQPPCVWLDEMDLKDYQQECEKVRAGKSVKDTPLRLAGKEYQHGIGCHSEAYWKVDLKGGASSFDAFIGIDDESGKNGSVLFEVWADRKLKYQSPLLKGGMDPVPVHVDLNKAKELMLVIRDNGDGYYFDYLDLADARFILKSKASPQPQGVPFDPYPMPVIHREIPSSPEIHSPAAVGGTPGRDFLYRIPVSGKRPLHFKIDNLPQGLSLDSEKGILSGKLLAAGTTHCAVKVQNQYGNVQKNLMIIAGKDSICLTPPMGWNHWNIWGVSINDEKVRKAADAMDGSGLADFGFQYINIDDGWQGKRTKEGEITSNIKFPDMKALGDYIHTKGLKFGIYSSPGPRTCGGLEGSYQHEYQDASTYAQWGVDYLKHDWCSYGEITPGNSVENLSYPYAHMKQALEAANRDVIYSLCEYGTCEVWKWGTQVGGHLWRTTGDISDNWQSVKNIFLMQKGLDPYAGPGHWNDPDMLVLGKVGWGYQIRPTRLTPREQISHMTMWAMLSAPLLLGCDMDQLDPFTMDLLTHEEVLAINQDYPGKQAKMVSQSDDVYLLVKPLSNGKTAIGFVNLSPLDNRASIQWDKFGLMGPQKIRDVWQRKELGINKEGYSTTLPPFGSVLLVVEPADNQAK
jgi:alpha-galactosidase